MVQYGTVPVFWYGTGIVNLKMEFLESFNDTESTKYNGIKVEPPESNNESESKGTSTDIEEDNDIQEEENDTNQRIMCVDGVLQYEDMIADHEIEKEIKRESEEDHMQLELDPNNFLDPTMENDVFPCKQCKFQTDSMQDIMKHIKSTHKRPRTTHCCTDCDFRCNSSWVLRRHMKVKHQKVIEGSGEGFTLLGDDAPDSKRYECDECKYRCCNSWDMKRHIGSRHKTELKAFKCHYEDCDYRAFRNNTLQRHVNDVHRKIKPFKCEQCAYTCSSRNYLEKHVRYVHDQLKPFACLECDRAFSRNLYLTDHINTVHKKMKAFACDKCEFRCNRRYELVSHDDIIHKKLKPYTCKECAFQCGRKFKMKLHIQAVHLNLKPYHCLICNDFKCTTREAIVRHSWKKHNTDYIEVSKKESDGGVISSFERSVNCPACNLIEQDSSVASSEEDPVPNKNCPNCKKMRILRKFQVMKCPECEYTCCQKYLLRNHINKRHREDSPYACQECKYKAPNAKNLQNHVDAIHKDIGAHKCEQCDKVFVCASRLKYHILGVHDKVRKLFNCHLCDYSCTEKRTLKKHGLRDHALEFDI